MADQRASILRPRRCVCLPPSSFGKLWATDLLGDLFATVSNMLKLHGDRDVHGDVWVSCVPPLNDQDYRSASVLPSSATLPVMWSYKGGTKVLAPV